MNSFLFKIGSGLRKIFFVGLGTLMCAGLLSAAQPAQGATAIEMPVGFDINADQRIDIPLPNTIVFLSQGDRIIKTTFSDDKGVAHFREVADGDYTLSTVGGCQSCVSQQVNEFFPVHARYVSSTSREIRASGGPLSVSIAVTPPDYRQVLQDVRRDLLTAASPFFAKPIWVKATKTNKPQHPVFTWEKIAQAARLIGQTMQAYQGQFQSTNDVTVVNEVNTLLTSPPDCDDDNDGEDDLDRPTCTKAHRLKKQLMVFMLNQLVANGTFSFDARPAAGKTGTADDADGQWFQGYTVQLADFMAAFPALVPQDDLKQILKAIRATNKNITVSKAGVDRSVVTTAEPADPAVGDSIGIFITVTNVGTAGEVDLSKALQRLSTGLKIKPGADDPPGLGGLSEDPSDGDLIIAQLSRALGVGDSDTVRYSVVATTVGSHTYSVEATPDVRMTNNTATATVTARPGNTGIRVSVPSQDVEVGAQADLPVRVDNTSTVDATNVRVEVTFRQEPPRIITVIKGTVSGSDGRVESQEPDRITYVFPRVRPNGTATATTTISAGNQPGRFVTAVEVSSDNFSTVRAESEGRVVATLPPPKIGLPNNSTVFGTFSVPFEAPEAVRAELYVDEVRVAEQQAPFRPFEVDSTTLAEGPHAVTVRITADDGRTASSTITVIVDNVSSAHLRPDPNNPNPTVVTVNVETVFTYRVFFETDFAAAANFYYVEMVADDPGFSGELPKPKVDGKPLPLYQVISPSAALYSLADMIPGTEVTLTVATTVRADASAPPSSTGRIINQIRDSSGRVTTEITDNFTVERGVSLSIDPQNPPPVRITENHAADYHFLYENPGRSDVAVRYTFNTDNCGIDPTTGRPKCQVTVTAVRQDGVVNRTCVPTDDGGASCDLFFSANSAGTIVVTATPAAPAGFAAGGLSFGWTSIIAGGAVAAGAGVVAGSTGVDEDDTPPPPVPCFNNCAVDPVFCCANEPTCVNDPVCVP